MLPKKKNILPNLVALFLDALLCPSKGVLHCTTHNPNEKASHNYTIVEELSEAPCSMLALEVLQSFPT